MKLPLERSNVTKSWGFDVVVSQHGAVVIKVHAGSIAVRSGLRVNHILFQIDGISVAAMPQRDIVAALADASLALKMSLRVKVPHGGDSLPKASVTGAVSSAPVGSLPAEFEKKDGEIERACVAATAEEILVMAEPVLVATEPLAPATEPLAPAMNPAPSSELPTPSDATSEAPSYIDPPRFSDLSMSSLGTASFSVRTSSPTSYQLQSINQDRFL